MTQGRGGRGKVCFLKGHPPRMDSSFRRKLQKYFNEEVFIEFVNGREGLIPEISLLTRNIPFLYNLCDKLLF